MLVIVITSIRRDRVDDLLTYVVHTESEASGKQPMQCCHRIITWFKCNRGVDDLTYGVWRPVEVGQSSGF